MSRCRESRWKKPEPNQFAALAPNPIMTHAGETVELTGTMKGETVTASEIAKKSP
jgi:hypothetical protein